MPISNSKRLRLLLTGHHGVGNVGDDAMLRFAIDRLRGMLPEASITLSAGSAVDPAWCDALGVRCVPRSKALLAFEMKAHDAVFVIGGTWLHSILSTPRYDLIGVSLLGLLAFARLLGKKSGLIGFGMGPLERKLGRKVAASCCRAANFVSFRDEVSMEWARRLGCADENLVRCADPAYGLKPAVVFQDPGILGISALPFHAGYPGACGNDGMIVEALSELAGEWLGLSPEHRVCLLPFNNKPGLDRDQHVLDPLLRRYGNTGRVRMADYSPDPGIMLAEVARCGAMIGMRYHSVLFAHQAGVPMHVIDYHPKTTTLLNEIGFPTPPRISAKTLRQHSLRGVAAALRSRPEDHIAARGPEVFEALLAKIWPEESFWASIARVP